MRIFARALVISSVFLAANLVSAKPIVAVYNLPETISETGQGQGISLFSSNLDWQRPITFFDLSKSLAKAAMDTRVQAIVIEADQANLGVAQVLEIQRHLREARQAGKDVWLFSDQYGAKSALLGSVANQFWILPEANVNFAGLSMNSLYFKGLLDKMGVAANVVHVGDYKSYGEELYRTEPSEYAAQQQKELLDGLFEVIYGNVGKERGVSQDKVMNLVNRGTFSAEDARQAGLVDRLGYRTDFSQYLKESYPGAKFEKSYELPKKMGDQSLNMKEFFRLFMQGEMDTKETDDYVAVVVMEGGISDETIKPVRRAILRLLRDEKARALVLRVDSPGGSALSSEVLWEVTQQWHDSGRPFAVSMGGVAASGGYYISAGADRIFAEEGTITGSIGVVGMKLVTAEAMEKLGITVHSMKRGKHADYMSMTRPFTDEEEELVRESMQDVYKTFLKRVRDGRGIHLKGELEDMAGGRVYTGRRALELGLVDEIGGLVDAIRWTLSQIGLPDAPVRLRPEPKSSFEELFESSRKEKIDDLIELPRQAKRGVDPLQSLLENVGYGVLPKAMRSSLQRGVERIRALEDSPIQLWAPDLQLNW